MLAGSGALLPPLGDASCSVAWAPPVAFARHARSAAHKLQRPSEDGDGALLAAAQQAQDQALRGIQERLLPSFWAQLSHAMQDGADAAAPVPADDSGSASLRQAAVRCERVHTILQELGAGVRAQGEQLALRFKELASLPGQAPAAAQGSGTPAGSFTFDVPAALHAVDPHPRRGGGPTPAAHHQQQQQQQQQQAPGGAPGHVPGGAGDVADAAMTPLWSQHRQQGPQRLDLPHGPRQAHPSWLQLQGLLDAHRAQVVAALVRPKQHPAALGSPLLHGGLDGVLQGLFGEVLRALALARASDGAPGPTMDVEDGVHPGGAGMAEEPGTTCASQLLRHVARVSELLARLGLHATCHEAATRCLDACVHAHCHSLTQGRLDERVLPAAWSFLADVPLRLAGALLQGRHLAAALERQQRSQHDQPTAAALGRGQDAVSEQQRQQVEAWRRRLEYVAYDAVGTARCGQVFDIVIDLPDSMPAVEDLAECLAHTNLQSHLLTTFRAAVSKRLLHAGASAADVVHTYVSIIRVMHALDPQGAMLPAVVAPVRRYLRSRPDTVRCVVEHVTGAPGWSLLGGSSGAGAWPTAHDSKPVSLLEEQQQEDLALEAQRHHQGGGPAPGVGRRHGAGSSGAWHEEGVLALLQQQDALEQEQDDAAGREGRGAAPWADPPPHQQRQAACSSGQLGAALSLATTSPGDVVGHLVQVFRSREHFIHEYQSCLALQLLVVGGAWDGDVQSRAVRAVELLKLRFGDARMHACEVMLKDVADSRRLNAACHALPPPSLSKAHPECDAPLPAPAWLSATVTSYLYWPCLGGWGDDQHAAKASPSSSSSRQGALATLAGDAALQVPGQVRRALDVYASHFQRLKAPRQLHWKPHLGLVELEIEVGGVSLEAVVSPVLASLLLAFDHEKEEEEEEDGQQGAEAQRAPGPAPGTPSPRQGLTAAQLASRVGVSAAAVRRRILFWVEAGVVVDHAPGGEPSGEVGARGAEGAGGAAAPATRYARATRLDPALHGARLTDVATWDEAASVGDEGREAAGSGGGLEHMAPFEPYVHSVLHNMGPMPLDRLHAMLKRFVISPKFDATPEQLASFLASLLAAGKVTLLAGNVYGAAVAKGAHASSENRRQ